MRTISIAAAVGVCMTVLSLPACGTDGLPADRPAAASYEVKGPDMKNGLATYVITSDYQEKPCPVWVLVPDRFDKARRYKVLYILPALGAGDKEGMREARKLHLADKYNIICVGPDFSRMPWYGDNPDNPKIRYDSYLPDVIVPFIDKTYPTITGPEGRVLVGFSKSGLGAVSLLLRHPEVFGRAGAWDTPLMEDGIRSDYYGSKENFMKQYYIPALLARRAGMLKGRPARIAITGLGWGATEQAHRRMEELEIPHHFNLDPKVNHEWKSGWLGPLVEVLMSEDMTQGKPAPASTGAATQDPAAAAEITVKGVIFSSWHYYKHEMPRNQSPKGTREKFELVLYAFDGPPDVKAAFDEMMTRSFPAGGGGMDAEHAIALQKEFDDRLRYYPDTGDEKLQAKLVYGWTWVPALASVTGVLREKDGRRWLTGARVTPENYRAKISSANPENLASFKYPPDCMLRPDKPLAMPGEKPVELNVAEDLTLKCVPIPPGRFIMGSPFYQCPRYQDECPVDVTLTKTFYFSEIPVTQEMFEAVMGKEASRSRSKGPQLAVQNTPFPDIREFCRRLSLRNKRVVRVPTAAELEYVSRLGNSSPCFPAKYLPLRTQVGAQKNPCPVKTKAPNAWGVYDLPAGAITAVSDWKAPNRPGKVTDPQGEPLDSSWVYYDSAIRSAQKPDRPVADMILKPPHMYPAVHKGGSGLDWDRPNMHDRYGEDGLDGGNGTSWVGIFRVIVEGP